MKKEGGTYRPHPMSSEDTEPQTVDSKKDILVDRHN